MCLDNQQYYTVTVHINNWFGNVNFNRWYKTADLVQAVPVLTVTESTLCCTNQSSQIDSLNSISCETCQRLYDYYNWKLLIFCIEIWITNSSSKLMDNFAWNEQKIYLLICHLYSIHSPLLSSIIIQSHCSPGQTESKENT